MYRRGTRVEVVAKLGAGPGHTLPGYQPAAPLWRCLEAGLLACHGRPRAAVGRQALGGGSLGHLGLCRRPRKGAGQSGGWLDVLVAFGVPSVRRP